MVDAACSMQYGEYLANTSSLNDLTGTAYLSSQYVIHYREVCIIFFKRTRKLFLIYSLIKKIDAPLISGKPWKNHSTRAKPRWTPTPQDNPHDTWTKNSKTTPQKKRTIHQLVAGMFLTFALEILLHLLNSTRHSLVRRQAISVEANGWNW
jgi:hypothetical protein